MTDHEVTSRYFVGYQCLEITLSLIKLIGTIFKRKIKSNTVRVVIYIQTKTNSIDYKYLLIF